MRGDTPVLDDRQILSAIGRRIRAARQLRRIGAERLGSAIGLSGGRVYDFEHGRSEIRVTTLFAIARALDLRVTWFLDDCGRVP